MTTRWMAGAVVAAVVLAGCGGSGGGSDAGDATTTTKATAASTTSTTEADLSEVGEEYQSLVEDADGAIDDEIAVRDEFAAQNDLSGGVDSTRDLRNELFDFDAAVRKLDVPEDQAGAVNDVLTETGSYIAVLDDYLDITEISEYNTQLDDEADARGAWYEAVNALADALGVAGVENEVDGSGTGSTTTTTAEEAVEAGDTVETSTASMEVPEGFTATAAATIQMTDGDGATIGLFNVYPDDADSLAEVAKASAEGAAEKNGYEIIGGPEDIEVGDDDAVGYAYDDGDGNSIVDIFFEGKDATGAEWHVISVEAPEKDIDAVMEALEAVLDTVVIS